MYDSQKGTADKGCVDCAAGRKLILFIHIPNDHLKTQEYLNKISNWTDENFMMLNVKKQNAYWLISQRSTSSQQV